MRTPPIGHVWIHIDRLDREDGKVWAVQDHGPRGGKRYRVAEAVIINAPCYSAFFGATGEQPKAVIVVPGATCEERGDNLVIDAKG